MLMNENNERFQKVKCVLAFIWGRALVGETVDAESYMEIWIVKQFIG